ncbi:MAG: amino acid adenylation domain-containing protein, partial [Silvanigrellaceae bacterium]|nr:amino acid adenylation domain-containing protein [Silvanigrellaceae bacterium]
NFIIENDNLIQIVQEKYKFHLISEEIFLNDIKNSFIDFVRPFNLESSPLIRFKLLKENNEKNILFIDIHHLINDGYSQNLLIQNLFHIYNNNFIDKIDSDYLDYSLIEEKIDKSKTIEFWKNNLIHFEKTQITFDFPKNDFNADGSQIILDIPNHLYDKIQSVTQKLKMTQYSFFLSAFAILVYKYSRSNQITIGGFFSGRHLPETQNMLGMFVSSLPILIEINNKNKIEEFLIEIQNKITDILENQNISLSELIEINKLNINNGRNPFFTNSFNFVELENYHSKEINFKNINLQNSNKSNFDLSLNLFKIENKIQAIFEYSKTSYHLETVQTVKEGFFQILNQITEINKFVNQIDFISPNEKNIILNKFNNTNYDFKNKLTFIELFQEKAKEFPNNPALVFKESKYTYHELNLIGNQIAHYIIDHLANDNDKIAIYLDESIELITGIIGILKASASYIPIPDSFPTDRVNEILKDSNSKILITNSNFKENIKSIHKDIKVIFLDKYEYSKYDKSNLQIKTKLEDCLYNIYTSGSTGKPKGVSINNKSTINFSLNIIHKLAINEKDQFSKFAGYGFDASIVEIMPCFISGSCLHIIEKSIKLDIPKLNQYFEDNNISISFLPTQFAELFMQQTENKSLRYLLTGGDRLKIVKNSNYKILNIYGPTEATVACTQYEVISNNIKNIPIGSPLLNYKIYITDSDMNLCPIGVEGELCISGDGLAVEYIQLPELTAQKFITNPFIENKDPLFEKYSKLYRTGDLAKWLPDGNIEFIGRIDFQVKIRGFRIELGEIEQSILNLNEIKECLVLPIKDNNQENYLCAYYVSPVSLEDSFISNYLSKSLPDYMIPSSFYWLKSFPINQNGKIDRKNLPVPEYNIEKNIILPENSKEEFIFQCAKEVLRLPQISMDSNFFQLGGNSLKAVEFVSKIQAKFNINISDIFKYKNLKTISSHLKDKLNEKKIEKNFLDKFPITESQKGIYFASIIDENSTIYNIPIAIEIIGKLNKDKLGESIDKIIQENRILRTKFILEENCIFQVIDETINIKKDFQKSRQEEISTLFNEFVTPFNLKESP